MSDYGLEDAPPDIFQEAAESLLYADPATAGGKLKHLITTVVPQQIAERERSGRLQAEHARSMQSLQKFMADNDAYQDPMIQAAARAAMVSEQMRDIESAGFSRDKFKASNGRDPTDEDVFGLHLQYRANGGAVRSSEKLLDAVALQLEDKFRVRRRIPDADRNARRAIAERQNAIAARNGQHLDDYRAQRDVNYNDTSSHGGRSIASERDVHEGDGGDGTIEGAGRRRGIDAMLARQAALETGMRFDRNADDYRPLDRRRG